MYTCGGPHTISVLDRVLTACFLGRLGCLYRNWFLVFTLKECSSGEWCDMICLPCCSSSERCGNPMQGGPAAATPALLMLRKQNCHQSCQLSGTVHSLAAPPCRAADSEQGTPTKVRSRHQCLSIASKLELHLQSSHSDFCSWGGLSINTSLTLAAETHSSKPRHAGGAGQSRPF